MTQQPVRSGLITAQMEIVEGGVSFHAPLCFDEEIVAETGIWSYGIDPDDDDALADALTDAYRSEFEAWCARKQSQQNQLADIKAVGHRVPQAQVHTPCPALWAGR